MEYNDEGILTSSQYEVMAKAYADALKKQGLKIVNIADEIDESAISSILEKLASIKSHLFALGGFLNTSSFYSLNERQLKKMLIIFDHENVRVSSPKTRDKTRCFLTFLSIEFSLINELMSISDKTNFENEIKGIISQRLSLLSKILAL